MSTTEAQSAANKANAAHSTGPQTPTGKARSSKNRLTFGLFTISDFVREDESESYTKICTSLWSELSPAGTIEEAFTTEIMSATWRLRRCRMVEEDIAGIAILDPMQDPETAAQQKSVDRARAQSVNIMNRCINALRKLQTERGIRSQAFPETDVPAGLGLMDLRQVARTKPMDTDADAEPEPTPAAAPPEAPAGFDALMALADKQLAQRYRDYGMAAFTGAPTAPATAPPAASAPCSPKHLSDLIRAEAQSQTNNQWSMGSNCKPAAAPTPAPAKPAAAPINTPRNAPCPCKSGQKFKRCCGKDSPIIQNRAA